MREAIVLALFATTLATVPAGAQDVAVGEQSFRKCAACHQVGETARNTIGPKLNGLAGRKSGSVEGFNPSAERATRRITRSRAPPTSTGTARLGGGTFTTSWTR